MSDDYLWDRSGPTDSEVERLERRLASFRGSLREPVWPAEPVDLAARRRRWVLPLAAAAGPPLLCHPFEIGDAASLPWRGDGGWHSPDPDYDTGRLTPDTLALLTPSTPEGSAC